MDRRTVRYEIITSENEDAPLKTDSTLPQFLRACQPEIDAQAFNRKFVSISNECLSVLKQWNVTTREKTQKFNTSTVKNNSNAASRRYYTSDYDDSSSYCSCTSKCHCQNSSSSANRRLQGASNDDSSQLRSMTFSFLPVVQKGSNYLKYCIGRLSEHEKPSNIRDCLWKYTSDPDWYCTEVNFALASDSSNLKIYGSYIKQLKYCIGMSPGYAGTVYRGVKMSTTEIGAYESQNMFFMPSFTSTSKTRPFEKNTLIHIDITPEWSKFCMEIPPSHTKYSQEEEVLLSCYNLYQYERTEKSNNKRIIKLSLVDYDKYFDYRTNTIQQ